MKAKVLKAFLDKKTKEVYTKGQIIEVTPKRFEEMNSGRFGVLVAAIQEKPEKKKNQPQAEAVDSTVKTALNPEETGGNGNEGNDCNAGNATETPPPDVPEEELPEEELPEESTPAPVPEEEPVKGKGRGKEKPSKK